MCLYDKQNNTLLLVDMDLFFLCSTRHLTCSRRSLVRYRVKHSKRNSISKRTQLLFSIYLSPERRGAHTFNQVWKGEGISRSNRV